MCENISYEPLAEVYLSVTDNFSDDIYCLCSRVVIRGNCNYEEQEEGVQPGDSCQNTGEENVVRFFNSSTESPPPQLKTFRKKENALTQEEVLSCYCSASHCSTDEHDSIRESSALHSDSGADLSESSRDLDWEKYWATHGEKLVWDSWITKYGDYIDPNYLNSNDSCSEETLFNVGNNPAISDLPKKTTFTGVLDSINEINESGSAENIQFEVVAEDQLDCRDELLLENLEKASEVLGEDDQIRLSYCSQSSSGKSSSSPTTTTTSDSMTSVTHMTISSSELSFSLEDSSVRSSSILSSSDSIGSYEQQWQQLWNDHCNQQYQLCYKAFTDGQLYQHHRVATSLLEDCSFPIDRQEPFHMDKSDELDEYGDVVNGVECCVDDDYDMQLDDNVIESNILESGVQIKKCRTRVKKKKSKALTRKQTTSVGYLLKSLHSLSVHPSDDLTAEEEVMDEGNSPPEEVCSRMKPEDDPGMSGLLSNCEDVDLSSVGKKSEMTVDTVEDEGGYDTREPKMKCLDCNSGLYLSENSKGSADGTAVRIKQKSEKFNLDRVKGAFNMMGFVFKPNNENRTMDGGLHHVIKKAAVVYRKRNIRSHNRSLKMAQPRHIFFNDDDAPQRDTLLDKVKRILETETIETSAPPKILPDISEIETSISATTNHRPETDVFSEKDDSTDEESVYSVEEPKMAEDDVRQEKKEGIVVAAKLQKKKRKKKFRKCNLPKEILENEKLLKYWYQRYRLFSKYDFGVKLDAESWFSVTPEKVSRHIAERCRCDVIVDAFCGAGGNTIQFAFTCERVIAIDIDARKIDLARHNASVYGVEDRIEFIVGDFLEVGRSLVADVVFLSPPWGGPQYMLSDDYNLDSLPLGGQKIFSTAATISPNVAFYLPKNFNTDDLVKLTGPGGSVEIEQNFLDKKLIAVTAYFGELVESLPADY